MCAILSGRSVSTIACGKRDFPSALASFGCLLLLDYQHLLEYHQCLHFCLLVDTWTAVGIFLAANGYTFCCGPLKSSNTCKQSTRGTFTPFKLNAGRVVFNRTSGSIYPNTSDTTTVTATSTTTLTTTATPATNLTTCPNPSTATPATNLTTCPNPSTSSNKVTAVGAGVSIPLGLALLGASGLLWSQRSRARREARVWEEKYDKLRKEQQHGGSAGCVEGPIQELGGSVGSVEGPTQELGGWRPDEIDGRLVYEIAGRRK